MKNIKQQLKSTLKWLTASLVFIATCVYANTTTLTAEADRTNININDQLLVTFRLQNGPDNVGIDLTPVQENFEVLNVDRFTESYTVNWETNKFVVWKATLAPKSIGTFTIPAISVAGASSSPISISVAEPPRSAADPNAETFLEVSVDKTNAYVQQQVLVTARLYSKYDWTGKQLEDFTLNQALIEAVSEDEYITELNGTKHLVYEVTFAVFPQASGTLQIPALDYAVQLRSGSSRSLLNFNNGPIRRGKSQPVSIEVKSIPSDNGMNTWLPAKNITLTQHFSRSPETLVAGEPVTRRITITADGMHPTQLPPIEIADIEGFSVYRDKAQTDETRNAAGIVGTRTETLAMVANQAGYATLPAISLRWFNTETNEYETASLPAVDINASIPAGAADMAPDVAAPPPQEFIPTNTLEPKIIERIPLWLIVTQSVTLMLVLALLPLAFRKKSQGNLLTKPKTEGVNTAWQSVKAAAAKSDLPALRRAIVTWSAQSIAPSIVSLHGLNQYLSNLDDNKAHATIIELKRLDQAIYSPDKTNVDLDTLLSGLQLAAKARPAANTKKALNPLYPNQAKM